MGKLIDADILIDSIPDLSVFEEEDFCTSDMIHLIESVTPAQAIPKDQYEASLKADMVAMLTEIQTEIEELDLNYERNTYYAAIDDCSNLMQQKINKLKENTDG